MRFICYVIYIGLIGLYVFYTAIRSKSHIHSYAPYTTACKADDIPNYKKGDFLMSRPAIPMELKKKHRREYMRRYRKQKLQQSFDTAFQRTRSPLTAEGNTDNNTADKMKGETQE